nr:MAG TPA: hypothetical protein [Caudoviricetes sp.]
MGTFFFLSQPRKATQPPLSWLFQTLLKNKQS